ncbi:MAG: tetratricopeptide repeat protein [bacterium]
MNRCKRCGKPFSPEDKFCGFCGFNFAALRTSELATQPALKVADIHFNLGKVYYEVGKYAQALEIFEKILEENPDDASVRDMYERAREALKSTTENPES